MATTPQPTVSAPIVCPGHSRPVVDVRYSDPSDDGVFLVSACHDKNPMMRWGDNGDWIGTFSGHNGAVWSACLDTGATRAATGSADFSAKLWDAVTGKNLHTFDHKHIVKAVEFHKDGNLLLTGGHEKKARVFDLVDYNAEPTCFELPSGIRKASWHTDLNSILCGCADGSFRVIDTRSGKEEKCCQVSKSEVQDLELSRNGQVVTIATGKTVSFYDANKFELLKQCTMSINVEAASLHPNGSRFVAGGSDLWVHVMDFESQEELDCHKGHHGPVFCVRYAPDGETYASGSEDGTIRIWKSSSSTNKEA